MIRRQKDEYDSENIQTTSNIDRKRGGGEGGGCSIIKIFWPIELNDLWSKGICQPKVIVWSGATFILRWSCFLANSDTIFSPSNVFTFFSCKLWYNFFLLQIFSCNLWCISLLRQLFCSNSKTQKWQLSSGLFCTWRFGGSHGYHN